MAQTMSTSLDEQGDRINNGQSRGCAVRMSLPQWLNMVKIYACISYVEVFVKGWFGNWAPVRILCTYFGSGHEMGDEMLGQVLEVMAVTERRGVVKLRPKETLWVMGNFVVSAGRVRTIWQIY